MASFTTDYEQKGKGKPKISESSQTLQVYSAEQLRDLLQKNGFMVIEQCGIDGTKFHKSKTDRILTIAKKMEIASELQRRTTTKAQGSLSRPKPNATLILDTKR